MRGNTRDVIQAHLYAFGRWEPLLTGWLEARLRPGDTFVDVGANIGYFTLLASQLVGPAGRVIGIEAHPRTYATLNEHVSLNRCTNVRTIQVAAAEDAGEIQIYTGPDWNSGMATTLSPDLWKQWVDRDGEPWKVDFTGKTHSVPAKRLESILAEEDWSRFRSIKIDVEGAELSVVRGLGAMLEKAPPGIDFFTEVNPGLLKTSGADVKDVFEPFTRHGYTPYVFEKAPFESYLTGISNPRIHRLEQLPDRMADIIFVRHSAATLRARDLP